MHKTVLVLALLVAAICAAYAAASCEVSAEAICQSNGNGLHCNPCRHDSYIVCLNGGSGIASCSSGEQGWHRTARPVEIECAMLVNQHPENC